VAVEDGDRSLRLRSPHELFKWCAKPRQRLWGRVGLALIGAVVGEFVSAQRGLGYLIASSTVNMSVATMFAAAILLAIIGIIATAAVRWLHVRVVFWEPQDPDAEE
jgi:ABC-type proline/glycine betaine transport system permease subunit